MSLGDAAEAFGPVLTAIGGLAMLGRQMLVSFRTPAQAMGPSSSETGGSGARPPTVVVFVQVSLQSPTGQIEPQVTEMDS